MNVYETFNELLKDLDFGEVTQKDTRLIAALTRTVKRAQDKVDEAAKPYNDNGDMVTRMGQTFRQIGWQVNGGERDGQVVISDNPSDLEKALTKDHGGYSPVYVKIGTD